MPAEVTRMRLDAIAEVNPTRRVRKGQAVSFIEMAALPQDARDIAVADIQERIARGAGAHFQNGDTLLARITPCLENGKTALVRALRQGEVGEGSTEFIVLCGIEPADNDFVYYVCRSPEFREYAIGRMEGTSGRQRVSWQSIAAFEFDCPEPTLRRSAASLLSLLDDRIDLLRRTNANLEGIAQTLFKSWFIDFDAIRAKAEGREPEGMDAVTAALFPDRLEASELGMVPKGWTIGTLAQLMRLHKGSINPGMQADIEFMHFSLPAFDSGQMPLRERGETIKSNKTTVPEDAVLLSKLNPHIPRVWLPSNVGENAVCSTEFLPFVPTGASTTAFLYSLLAAPDFRKKLGTLVTGTSNSHQRVKPDGVLSMPFVIPSAGVIAAFDLLVSGLLARLKSNRLHAQTLAAIRDSLLPRLISGQLRLLDARAQIEEVLT